MAKVFISSTSIDLRDYRDAAIEECNRLGLVPIAMEFFEAMAFGAAAGSKQKLDGADLYVGIFAHRYGYIEEGQDKGITEIEFDHATERGLDRLCFLVDPDWPWPDSLTGRMTRVSQHSRPASRRVSFAHCSDPLRTFRASCVWH